MTSKVLVKFSKDWADEFLVEGFKLFTAKRWADLQEEVLQDSDSIVDYYFGSNEGWEGDETLEEFLESYTVINITDEEYDTLSALFQDGQMGVFPNPDELL